MPFLLRPARPPVERTDDIVTVITSHNEAIRFEFGRGFARWYRERTGRTVAVDWRVIGGTSEITRFLESAYLAAFRQHWTSHLRRPWNAEVQRAFAAAHLPQDASAAARDARAAFLASDVSCGMDVFFGGGPYDFVQQAAAGRIVAPAEGADPPEWRRDDIVPAAFAGEPYRDSQNRWVGNVLSTYGILYNRDSLRRLGVPEPRDWRDLADPRLVGEVALADPTKSSSIAKAFENILQQVMQRHAARLTQRQPIGAREPVAIEAEAVRVGWIEGMRLLQLIGANARSFADSSQKPPIDVGQGDCAVGICIDFYGRAQAEATLARETGESRLGFATPPGGTIYAVDPIALLRGAPHRAMGEAFIAYTLTLEAQKLWAFRPGTPGGPERFALRRLPVRRDFYAWSEWKPLRSDPDANPYADVDRLIYRPERTGPLVREMAFVVRVMVLDTHSELVRAWRAVQGAPEPARTRALAALQDLSPVNYDRMTNKVQPALRAVDRTEELKLARELGDFFRRNYAEAERLAGER